MKTTVDLPDELLIEAKKLAAETRRPLREILAEGLRLFLRSTPAPTTKTRIRWVTVNGGLPPVDIADREQMAELISCRS